MIEENKKEKFVPVKGFENYEVSNLGRVKRVPCEVIYRNGTVARYPEKILKPDNVKGYLRVTLSKDNNQKRFTVHRLVAKHFIPNRGDKKYVNHKDGNKSNNSAHNLEWVTASQNERHSYESLGKVNPQRKLSKKAVDDILKNAVKGKFPFNTEKGNISHFMDKYRVSRKTVLNVINKKYYV